MAGLQIPLKAGGAGTAVAYDTAVDGAYSIYGATLKDYPVASAFPDWSDTSQVKWGLQVSARSTQNTAWKAQLGYGVASGTGALSLNSITYPFSRTIGKLDSGNVRVGLLKNGFSNVTFNFGTSKISTVYNTPATSITTGTQNLKGYVATNTNKFLAVCDGTSVKTYPVDSNGTITSATAASTAVMANTTKTWVAAAKGAYIWVCGWNVVDVYNSSRSVTLYGQLYTITSAGVLSTVWAATTIYTHSAGWSTSIVSQGQALGSYVASNVSHIIGAAWISGTTTTAQGRIYNTVDLTNTTVFTTTIVKQEAGTLWTTWSGSNLIVWYDGSFGLVVTNIGTAATPDIYKVNAAGGFVDSTVNYFETYLRHCRFKNSTTLLSTATSNTFQSSTNSLKINNNSVTWTYTALETNQIWIYEMTGTNQEDDTNAFKWLYIPTSAIGPDGGSFTIKINGTLAQTVEMNHIGHPVTDIGFNFASPITINSTKINFLVEYPNTLSKDLKIGFGINGGTYASPTGTFELSTINLALS